MQLVRRNLLQHLKDAVTVNSFDEALTAALQEVQEGDIVLFSPAFSSFGIFKNEYDRNDQFMAAVKNI